MERADGLVAPEFARMHSEPVGSQGAEPSFKKDISPGHSSQFVTVALGTATRGTEMLMSKIIFIMILQRQQAAATGDPPAVLCSLRSDSRCEGRGVVWRTEEDSHAIHHM